jgi:plastocyanin
MSKRNSAISLVSLMCVGILGYVIFLKSAVAVPSATIVMTRDGFSPSEVTIQKGQAILFVNGAPKDCPLSEATCNFWPASDLHPTHELYPEFDPRQPVGPGETWTFVFERTGAWRFHDHFHSNKRGIITVTK